MPEQHPLRGVALMLAALFCFALLDATSKHLSQTFNVPLLVWARYTVHCLLMLVFLGPSQGARLVATARPFAQIGRALLLVAVTGFAMAAFRVMPLAETTALVFVTPLIVALLAGPFLGERVGAPRWLAALVGFGGTLLIARPGGTLPPDGILYTMIAAVCYAFYQIQTRKMAATERPVTMVFYTALVGTAAMSLALPWIWTGPAPEPLEAVMIASLAIYGGTGHFLLTHAFRHAPASTLAPFLYAQLIWASLLGWLFYDQWPDTLSIAGMLTIVAGGVAVAVAERTGARRIDLERG
ncbi:MAG TPA: DMT family transporter [Rhodocyclaceae bacterium]|nr:DMT family transporter [Rhodocyclaceae bacterium]